MTGSHLKVPLRFRLAGNRMAVAKQELLARVVFEVIGPPRPISVGSVAGTKAELMNTLLGTVLNAISGRF